MEQSDAIVEMLSEHRSGSKLKRITKESSPALELSLISFIFEGENEKVENIIGIAGRDLQISFGRKSID